MIVGNFFIGGIMARKRLKLTFNFGWILFMIFMYNIVFDDSSDKQVEIVDQEQAIEEKIDVDQAVNDIKKDLKSLANGAKILLEQAKDEIVKKEDEPPPNPDEGREMVAEPEPEKMKPIEQPTESKGGFKKL